MGRCNLLPKSLGRVNRHGVPDLAVVSSLAVGCALFLIGPGWQQVVAFLTAAQMIALAMGPESLFALRKQLPEEMRTFSDSLSHRTQCPVFRDGDMGDELVRTHSAKRSGASHRNPKPAVCSSQLEETQAH